MQSTENPQSNDNTGSRIGPIGLENPLVQQTLQVAEEIIGNNKVLSAEYLYKLAKRRLKAPRKELMGIIQWLLKKRILLEGSKLTRQLVLSNQFRSAIYEFIKGHLGVNFCLIKQEVGPSTTGSVRSPGQLIWHLQMLIKYEFVKRIKYKNYSIFTPADIEPEMGVLVFLLRDEINRKIVELLLEHNSIKRAEVFKEVNEGRELIYYRINSLIDSELLSNVDAEEKEIQLNPLKKAAIIEVLNRIRKEES